MIFAKSFFMKGCAAGAILAAAAGCASHGDYAYAYDPYGDYGYDGSYSNDGYYYYGADRPYDPYRGRDQYHGIDGARVAHRIYSDARAEGLDGSCGNRVRILRGETLSDIAEFCDVPVAAILDTNPAIYNPRYVSAGELIRVPHVRGEVYEGSARLRYGGRYYDDGYLAAGALQTDRSGRTFYRIRRGDTLAEIAQDYGVSLRDIAYLNPGVHPYSLDVGQRIYLPDYVATAPGRRDVVHRDYADIRDISPIVSISPRRGPRDGEIRVVADGLRQGGRVAIFVGHDRDELSEIKIVEADGDGRIDEIVRLPNDYRYEEAYWAIRPEGGDYFLSEAYTIDALPASRYSDSGYHSVRDGETLAWIARRYGVPMQDLVAVNPDADWTALQAGARLRLPDEADLDARSFASEPFISVARSEIALGESVALVAEGFPAETPVSIYAGPSRNRLTLVTETRTGPGGRFVVDAEIPPEIDADSVLFVAAVEDGARTIVSERVRLIDRGGRQISYDADEYGKISGFDGYSEVAATPTRLERGAEGRGGGLFSRFRSRDHYAEDSARGGSDDRFAVAGVLTNEGVNCPALRDDAGNLFLLLGDLEGFDDGDRVLVDASARADDRICNQAETLQVFNIQSAPW